MPSDLDMRQNKNFCEDGSSFWISVLNSYFNVSNKIRSRLCNRKDRVYCLRKIRQEASDFPHRWFMRCGENCKRSYTVCAYEHRTPLINIPNKSHKFGSISIVKRNRRADLTIKQIHQFVSFFISCFDFVIKGVLCWCQWEYFLQNTRYLWIETSRLILILASWIKLIMSLIWMR